MTKKVQLLSTRSAVLAGAMLLALALIALALVGTTAKQADAATQTVTKSFSNTSQITIPEGAPTSTTGAALPYPSTISSAFPTGSKVLDVDVTFRNYTHTYPDDVDVLLAHAGANRTIMSDVGGPNDVGNITLTLNDEASNGALTDQGQLNGGAFQPTNINEGTDTFDYPAPSPANANSALSGFDGTKAGGGWKLFVEDAGTGDYGKFAGGWTVKIKAAVPQQ